MTTAIETTELMVVTQLSAVQLFAPGAPEKIIDKIRTEALTAASALDISTDSGRKAIASLAYKVARTKTFLDDQGKELVADLKKQTGAIDAERKRFRDELDALKEEVRKPLTEFENADKQRIASHEAELREIETAGSYSLQSWQTLSAQAMRDRLAEIEGESRDWQEFGQRAAGVKAVVVAQIKDAIAKRERQDALEAENARLRADAAEREKKEREERIAREAKEAAERAAQVEQERIERMRVEAEQAEARRKQEAEDAKRRAKEAAEAATKAERERAERERLAAEEETRKREANKRHRAKIEGEITDALDSLGVSPSQCEVIIAAIAAGKVPHVRIEY